MTITQRTTANKTAINHAIILKIGPGAGGG